MNTKLTLRLDDNIINRIKLFSAKKNLSLSKFTENLFKKILDTQNSEYYELSPITKKYKGILKNIIIDEKADITEYLIKKH